MDIGLLSEGRGNKSLEELLRNGGFCAIDYVLRNSNVPAQFIPFIDISYLSNESLTNAVGILNLAFRSEASVDFTGLFSPHDYTDATKDFKVDTLFFVEADDFLRSLINSDFSNVWDWVIW